MVEVVQLVVLALLLPPLPLSWDDVVSGALVSVSVTGKTVVEMAMVDVTTWLPQLVAAGPHDVTVKVLVV